MKLFIPLLIVVTLIGCGGSGAKETAEVKGTVTLNGKPLPGSAGVMFEPIGGGKMATGSVQSDGSFVLKTYEDGDGAIVGKHRASVSPTIPFVSEDAPDPPPSNGGIPPKYHSATTSGWEFEVKPGEVNEFMLEMKSE
jgi:hypothetical protein